MQKVKNILAISLLMPFVVFAGGNQKPADALVEAQAPVVTVEVDPGQKAQDMVAELVRERDSLSARLKKFREEAEQYQHQAERADQAIKKFANQAEEEAARIKVFVQDVQILREQVEERDQQLKKANAQLALCAVLVDFNKVFSDVSQDLVSKRAQGDSKEDLSKLIKVIGVIAPDSPLGKRVSELLAEGGVVVGDVAAKAA